MTNQTSNPNKPATLVVTPTKSVGVAVILTFFFGPLGMFYSTVSGAIVMMIASAAALLLTLGLGLLITWPICIIWAARAAKSYNQKLMEGVVKP